MTVYMVVEAGYHIGLAASEAQSLGAYAIACPTMDEALSELRELADGRIYEAYAGLDEAEREERTDEAMRDLFAHEPDPASLEWTWENCERAYAWRIIKGEVE